MDTEPPASAERETYERLSSLVKSRFPDLRCLRCGNGRFYLVSDADALRHVNGGGASAVDLRAYLSEPDLPPVVTLACTNCGHLEHHLTGILSQSSAPVPAWQEKP